MKPIRMQTAGVLLAKAPALLCCTVGMPGELNRDLQPHVDDVSQVCDACTFKAQKKHRFPDTDMIIDMDRQLHVDDVSHVCDTRTHKAHKKHRFPDTDMIIDRDLQPHVDEVSQVC